MDFVVRRIMDLRRGRPHTETAALLGLSRSHWAHIRSGRRPFTYARLQRAVQVFPELLSDVVADLAHGDHTKKSA